MKKCSVFSLSQIVERYCILLFNDHRKGFKNFLVMAQMVWEEIFNRTLWCYQAEWLPVIAGEPYPFIELPENVSFFMHLCDEVVDCDGVKRLMPLLRDSGASVGVKPAAKKCGCKENCNCGEACNEANSFSFSEKEVVIDNVTYYEREWMQVCPNGDVIKWREVPVKNYSNGRIGVFSTEFNPNDFPTPETIFLDEGSNIESDYYIDVIKIQERLCKLEVKPCGCIAESAENKNLLVQYCGCSFSGGSRSQPTHRDKTYYQFSDCGRKIYIIGAAKDMYHLTYQASGASSQAPVPQYATKALMDGIDYYSKVYNPSLSMAEKRMSKGQYDRSCLDIIEYLNPIDLDILKRLTDFN